MIHVPQLSVKLPWSKHNTKWLKPLKKTGWISLPRKPWKIGWSIWQFNSSLWNHHLLPWAIYSIANCKKSPEVNINWTNSLLLCFFLRLNSSWKHVFKHIQTLHCLKQPGCSKHVVPVTEHLLRRLPRRPGRSRPSRSRLSPDPPRAGRTEVPTPAPHRAWNDWPICHGKNMETSWGIFRIHGEFNVIEWGFDGE